MAPKPPVPLRAELKQEKKIEIDKSISDNSAQVVNIFRQYLGAKLENDEAFRKETLRMIRQWMDDREE